MPRPALSRVLAALGAIASATNVASADAVKGTSMTATTITARPAAAIIDSYLPAGYREAARRAVTVDGEAAELVRYQRTDGRNAALGGEHFSTVIAANGRLKGFARIDLDLVGGALPSRDQAQAIAMEFLAQAAPDLLRSLKISWIEPHDEPLRVTRDGRSEELTLTGMKVKMRNTADGRWMWVIVGADRKVMVFERDIVWITMPGKRGTEKWLHDSWLAERS
ncbi:hypothetical protein BJ122_12513 [Rhodopseudomonas faecalis]|uniref:Uncharacterized protein n=1 Tax=Rhodopseudomonas faecalis TaxID=99655 RepID=A0A318T849_9BRAD|nr:hypothetical protein [Rhodopseudomonas faecalis]PYF01181.1 hypothetical protein BJ122_12513 [Rhodopseudomonas faecalis]TAH66048.1 MAG: hypothetical protein EWM45_12710 [Rhodopseudomonas palustris]